MPPLALASLLQRALPWLSVDGRAVINTLICENGRVGSANALSSRLGLRNRYQLGRLLQREGLPPYEELAGWISVFYWMLRADSGDDRGALRSLASRTGLDAASSYRLVRRITGRRWTDLRRAGIDQVVRWFEQRTHPRRAGLHMDVPTMRQSYGHPQQASPPGSLRMWSDGNTCRLELAGAPYGVAVVGGLDGDLAYITLGHGAALQALDLTRRRLIRSISVGATPTCVIFDPSGTRAYVSVQYCDHIAVVDVTRHVQIRSFRVPADPFPLALSARRGMLFVATNEDRLLGLSLHTGSVVESIPLPATSHHLALHPAGDRLYIATRAAGSVLEVDITRLKVLRSFALGGWPQGLVVAPDGATLYVANEHHGVDVIRLASGKRITSLDGVAGAVELAMTPDHRFLYAGHPHAGRVSVIELPSLKSHGAIQTGGRPGLMAFDRWGRVLIANQAGWLDILPVGGLRVAAPGALSRDISTAIA